MDLDMDMNGSKPPTTIRVREIKSGDIEDDLGPTEETYNTPTRSKDISLSDHDASVSDHRHLLGDEDDEFEEARKIAERETYSVRIWRFVTTDVIICVSVCVILTAYAVLRDFEKQDFEDAYLHSSETLAAAVLSQHQADVSSLNGFPYSMLGHDSTGRSITPADNLQWPFVLPSDFQPMASLFRQLSTIQTLYYAPLVTPEQETDYLTFVTQAVAEETPQPFQTDFHPFFTHLHVDNDTLVEATPHDMYLPLLASSPPDRTYRLHNWNLFDLASHVFPTTQHLLDALAALQPNQTLFVPPRPNQENPTSVDSYLMVPILKRSSHSFSEIVGIVAGAQAWEAKLSQSLAQHMTGLVVVLTPEAHEGEFAEAYSTSYTFRVDGNIAVLLGQGDLHDPVYDQYELLMDLGDGFLPTQLHLQMRIYPSRSLELSYRTSFPEWFTLVLFIAFLCVATAFFKYDILVDHRNEKLIDKFARSNRIVSQLYPKMYHDRLLGNDDDDNASRSSKKSATGILKKLMTQGEPKTAGHADKSSKALADIFPSVTIFFGDIAGFTAWSSQREPYQVFRLLETLYAAFDKCAEKRRVFKIETIGDCYVAATGLPQPRRQHAKAMVRFACDIMAKMIELTRELEVELGPDTGDLKLRAGIHSGAVTAGILRGQKARFQLFGDAMNTASRIESNGLPGKIQVSQSTADMLFNCGCGHWLTKREDKISAKGKGLLQTYWVTKPIAAATTDRDDLSSASGFDVFANLSDDEASVSSQRQAIAQQMAVIGVHDEQEAIKSSREARRKRLVAWNVETLLRHIKLIVSHRASRPSQPEEEASSKDFILTDSGRRKLPMEEVKEIITLPEYERPSFAMVDPATVQIPEIIVQQLESFVTAIGLQYNDCEFHNFDHASHVTNSVSKLLSRIVGPREDDPSQDAKAAHESSFGITSDPLTQFACVLSALVHDLDHFGIPNSQLVKEKADLAEQYAYRSVAEQHSLDLAWDLFMCEKYDELRSIVCSSSSELQRLREIVVNAVLATDIVDTELKALRNARWEKAFSSCDGSNGSDGKADESRDSINRKATIVIEHLMQASDIAHTMQHWHVFTKWNERLLREVYKAYREGRCNQNPLDKWYEGELGFFDFYVIPLAKKLKDCGVFGVASDEYLDYAMLNREEWEAKGQKLVAAIAEALEKEYDGK